MNVLFTPDYATEQQRLHQEDAAYGSRGFNWAYLVAGIARIEGCSSILDYGCGKGTMGRTLRKAGLDARDYDPGIPSHAARPEPADLVVSVDVFEHIEGGCVAAVIDHLATLTQQCLFVAVSTIPAKRWLSDGRNTHLTIREGEWWRAQLERPGFNVRRVWKSPVEWAALLNAPGRPVR